MKFKPETCAVIVPWTHPNIPEDMEPYYEVTLKNKNGRMISHCYGNDARVVRFKDPTKRTKLMVTVHNGWTTTGTYWPDSVLFDGDHA